MAPSSSDRAPLPLALTMGDPCGIGPEIILMAMAARPVWLPRVAVWGDLAVMRRAQAVLSPVPNLEIRATRLQDLLQPAPDGVLRVVQVTGAPAGLAELPWGLLDAKAGLCAVKCIEAACGAVRAGLASAVVTAPIHKEALALSGSPFPGHTEMLQALAAQPGMDLPPVRMMLANEELRVVLVTVHMALRHAIEALSTERILETIRLAHEAESRRLGRAPRIAVAGLNPHAGEGGLFGDEEGRIIAPAIEQALRQGWDVQGPFAPDTVFMRARHTPARPGAFDLVVAMTHDHGLIPVKYLGLEQGVNITLGLPFVRTSPDHGTAFDLAGRGLADPSSFLAALGHAWALRA
jgi:4-hydroxythreonine-4-phosphate dehydrogenase